MTTLDEEITGYGGLGKTGPDMTTGMDTKATSDSVAKEAAEEVRAKARQAAEEVKAQGKRQLDGYRETAADEIEKVAHSAEAAARELEGQDTLGLSGYVSDMAQGMVRLSDNLRGKSVDELFQDVNRLARDNPTLFIAGSIALGFGLTRFARASGRRAEDEYSHRSSSGAAAASDQAFGSRTSSQHEFNQPLNTGEPGSVGSISNAGGTTGTRSSPGATGAGLGAADRSTPNTDRNGKGTDGGLYP